MHTFKESRALGGCVTLDDRVQESGEESRPFYLSNPILYLFLVVHNISFWKRKWQPTPVFLREESHGQRSLMGCNPLGYKESDMTE